MWVGVEGERAGGGFLKWIVNLICSDFLFKYIVQVSLMLCPGVRMEVCTQRVCPLQNTTSTPNKKRSAKFIIWLRHWQADLSEVLATRQKPRSLSVFFSSSYNPGELWVSVQMAELITYSLLTTELQGGVLVQVHMKYTVYMWPQMFGHADHWLVVYNSSSESSSSCKVFINVLALVCYIVTAHSLEQCIVLFQYHLNHDKWLSQYDTMWHNVHNRLNK